MKKENSHSPRALWTVATVLFFGFMFGRLVYPEKIWITAALGVMLLASLGGLAVHYQKELRSRTAAYGLNSLVTILLVIGIVGVLNFLAIRYTHNFDLTKNQIHTLSDQSIKVTRGLQKPVKATLFAKLQQKEQIRPLLENYKNLSTQFELEFTDPDREPTRAKQLGIKKYGTLLLSVGTRDTRLEEVTEEKLTNALIKLLKEKNPTLCATTGHGEKNFGSPDAEGYQTVKKALGDQSYEVKDLNLIQENKVPETCDAVAIIGPTRAFFEPETKILKDYLAQGGRALVALDLNLKGTESSPELISLLKDWHIKPDTALIVDPVSRMLGVDSSVAILASFAKDNSMTKDFQNNCAFPFTRPLDIIPGAPETMKVNWIAQTTPKAWGVTDLKELTRGEVRYVQGKDKAGPLNAAVAIDGKAKDSKASKNTRMVVFGSSYFATNNFIRYMGNQDFFLNAVSWVMEDESLISIRTKEDGPGKVELSQKAGTFIFLLTVIAIPLIISGAGVVIWAIRRKL